MANRRGAVSKVKMSTNEGEEYESESSEEPVTNYVELPAPIHLPMINSTLSSFYIEIKGVKFNIHPSMIAWIKEDQPPLAVPNEL